MRALVLLPNCCSVPICLFILGVAALVALLAGDRQQSHQIWAVIQEALQKIILKGGA